MPSPGITHNGTAPLPVWSSNRERHRQLNAAIHRIALTQAQWHPDARAFMARRRERATAAARPCAPSSAGFPTWSTERYKSTPLTIMLLSPLDRGARHRRAEMRIIDAAMAGETAACVAS